MSLLAGRRGWLLPILAMVVIAAAFATYKVLERAFERTVELQAVIMADLVARHAMIVHQEHMQALAAGPAVIARRRIAGAGDGLAGFAGRAGDENGTRFFSYRLTGFWQGAAQWQSQNDFERWAWLRLQAQDRSDADRISWKPVWRVESIEGTRMLRFMAPAPASIGICLDCHDRNRRYARNADRHIPAAAAQAQRRGPERLLGAVAVAMPLDQMRSVAFTQHRPTIIWISTILIGVFIVVTGVVLLNFRVVRTPAVLSAQATRDELTGLLNRAGLEMELDGLFASSHARGRHHAVCCVTITGLAEVERAHGAAGRDAILKRAGARLQKCVRGGDVVARVGTNRFVILARACELPQAKEMAKQLEQTVSRSGLELDGTSIAISATTAVTVIGELSGTVSSVMDMMALTCRHMDGEMERHEGEGTAGQGRYGET